MQQAILVFDCGATNIRAVLINSSGEIVCYHSISNNTVEDPYLKGGLIWNLEEIWKKLCICSKTVINKTKDTYIVSAISVTTFGVDGAPVSADGNLLYPVISWQCNRTIEIAEKLEDYFDKDLLFHTNGLQSFHFNTLFRLIWFKENHPDILEKMHKYLFMPSLIIQKLTGEMVNDITMAGTSMLTNLKHRDFECSIFNKLHIGIDKLYPMANPGSIAGYLKPESSNDLGMSGEIPVVIAGHDTQFAIFGAGASVNEAVLSSGTWEILSARTNAANLIIPERKDNITIEFDVEQGFLNPSLLWVASGVLEWITDLVYNQLPDDSAKYDEIISEAEKIPIGCEGVKMLPELYSVGISGKKGSIDGISHQTSRAHIYRAALEALSFYTRFGLTKLEKTAGFKAESVICVGGGSKNRLWNQIRADVLGIVVKIPERTETTVHGAACYAMYGLGWFKSPADAEKVLKGEFQLYYPQNHDKYNELYTNFIKTYFQ